MRPSAASSDNRRPGEHYGCTLRACRDDTACGRKLPAPVTAVTTVVMRAARHGPGRPVTTDIMPSLAWCQNCIVASMVSRRARQKFSDLGLSL